MEFKSILERFVKECPHTVMVRALLEHAFSPEKLNTIYEEAAEQQYTRELLFSSIFELMHQVVFKVHPSIHAAYEKKNRSDIGVSLTSVYNKLNGIEDSISEALVRYSAESVIPIIKNLSGEKKDWLNGYNVRLLDGNCIEGTEHRLEVLRNLPSAALPGKTLVVLDPALATVVNVFLCQDGHAQERSLLSRVLESVEKKDLWICDRNFCVLSFLQGISDKKGTFIIRQHQNLPFEEISPFTSCGEIDTGKISEQKIRITNDEGKSLILRRIRIELSEPTRDGDTVLYIVSNLPSSVCSGKRIAELYRKRWTIETAFQHLEKNLHSEINTLGYPKAALFGFCVALIAYNIMAVIFATLVKLHGEETVQNKVSSFHLTLDITGVYRGMMIAIPQNYWITFSKYTTEAMCDFLMELAEKIDLSKIRKKSSGKKKPVSKKKYDSKKPHVSTARLLANAK